jgi:hypothetical protein
VSLKPHDVPQYFSKESLTYSVQDAYNIDYIQLSLSFKEGVPVSFGHLVLLRKNYFKKTLSVFILEKT